MQWQVYLLACMLSDDISHVLVCTEATAQIICALILPRLAPSEDVMHRLRLPCFLPCSSSQLGALAVESAVTRKYEQLSRAAPAVINLCAVLAWLLLG